MTIRAETSILHSFYNVQGQGHLHVHDQRNAVYCKITNGQFLQKRNETFRSTVQSTAKIILTFLFKMKFESLKQSYPIHVSVYSACTFPWPIFGSSTRLILRHEHGPFSGINVTHSQVLTNKNTSFLHQVFNLQEKRSQKFWVFTTIKQ